MRRVRVPTVQGHQITLDGSASKHLIQVLRLPLGARVQVYDGAGHWAEAEVSTADRRACELTIAGSIHTEPLGQPVHLALALLKGPAMDLAIRMATECGMTELHVFTAQHTQARPPRVDRWAKIVDAAAHQSGRFHLPRIHPVVGWAEVRERLQSCPDRRIAQLSTAPAPKGTTGAAIAVGPEGGWAAHEFQAALDEGWVAVGLAPHVLRASTAAAVAVASIARP